MLVLLSPRSARSSSAKFVPESRKRPAPSVRPVGSSARVDVVRIGDRRRDAADAGAADRLVEACRSAPCCLESVLPTAQFTPSSALLSSEMSTRIASTSTWSAADVELVHDRHDRAHDLRRRGDDQRVGLLVGPDRSVAIGCGLRAAWRAAGCARRGLRDAGHLFLQLAGDLLGVSVVQIADVRVAARLERRVEVCDERLQPQALRLLAGDQHAVGAIVGDQPCARRQPLPACWPGP